MKKIEVPEFPHLKPEPNADYVARRTIEAIKEIVGDYQKKLITAERAMSEITIVLIQNAYFSQKNII